MINKNIKTNSGDCLYLELEQSKEIELLSYQVALLQVKVNCTEQLDRIQLKLEGLKK